MKQQHIYGRLLHHEVDAIDALVNLTLNSPDNFEMSLKIALPEEAYETLHALQGRNVEIILESTNTPNVHRVFQQIREVPATGPDCVHLSYSEQRKFLGADEILDLVKTHPMYAGCNILALKSPPELVLQLVFEKPVMVP